MIRVGGRKRVTRRKATRGVPLGSADACISLTDCAVETSVVYEGAAGRDCGAKTGKVCREETDISEAPGLRATRQPPGRSRPSPFRTQLFAIAPKGAGSENRKCAPVTRRAERISRAIKR